ncbi:MAG: FtsX-like permease family protein [Roseivirga sp.]|nr:FtsX-like permease family protein [Roseivirga sp.]
MLKNHIQTAIRNLTKRRFVSLINLTGLSISLTLFIIIGLYISFETSYDGFHQKADNIYMLTKEINTPTNQDVHGLVNYLEGPLLAQDNPQVNQVVRFYKSDNSLSRYGDDIYQEDDFFFVDKNVFEVFDFGLLVGSEEQAFRNSDDILITEETAMRYFGRLDVLGEVISVTEQYWNVTNDFKVAGIVENPPTNSHIQFDFLASFDAFDAITEYNTTHDDPVWLWGWNAFMAYVELNPGVDRASFDASLEALVQKHYRERDKEIYELSLTPLEEVYMSTEIRNGFDAAGNPRSIKVLSGVALFILIIACINFINLTTARSSLYAKEIGVKKVLGARRVHLFFQLITESMLLTLLAIVLALVTVELTLPVFEDAIGKSIEIDLWALPVLTRLIGIGLLIGALAGCYPAISLSGFKALTALKGERVQAEGRFSVRKILVVFQFTVSLVLVVGSMVIYKQLVFISDKDLGFDQDELLFMELPSGITTADTTRYELMQERMRQLGSVHEVTSTESRPGVFVSNEFVLADGAGEGEKVLVPTMWVDDHFFETFNIELTAGASTKYEEGASIRYYLNQSAKEMFQWEDAIGKPLAISSTRGVRRQGFVAGEVPDFNFESLYNPIKPMLIGVKPNHLASGRWNLFVRANTTEYTNLIAELNGIWSESYPDRPFNISFLDQVIERQYQAQSNLLKILPWLTGFAVFIACLGLFGLASFVVERRTKEVGIRKVLGASVQQVVVLISSDFMKLLLIANFIAWPVAFFYLKDWLSNFNYHIPLSWTFFLMAGLLVMFIAFFTVGLKVVKGARSNPVDSLRYE